MSRGITDSAMDVCVICAIPVEARAFLAVLDKEGTERMEQGFSKHRFEYHYKTILNNVGEQIRVQVSLLPYYGSTVMVQHATFLLEEFKPRFVAMTGICAGERQKVYKGDLIVAERAFAYDTGKFIAGEDGKSQQQHDTRTMGPSDEIVQRVHLFDKWKTAVAHVKRPPTEAGPARRLPACHVVPLASGNAVRADNPFAQIQVPVRGAIAIDMEGAAFYHTMHSLQQTHALIVKAVSDYADGTKDDSYQEYASTVSAVYMLAFIKQYVNAQLMPGTGRAAPEPPTPVKAVSTLAKANDALLQEPQRQVASKPAGALSILFVYAPEDKEFYQGIEKQLAVMSHLGIIQIHDMQRVLAGELIQQNVQQKLGEADIILVLMTPALFTSDDLLEQQLEPAWKQRARGALVIPVLTKPVAFFEKTKYKDIQPLPQNRKPITRWSTRDGAYFDIAEGLQKLIEERNKPAKHI